MFTPTIDALQVSSVNISLFTNPPRFPFYDCPVIWKWTISNGSTAAAVRSDQQPQLVSRAVMAHPRVQASTHESFE